MKSLATPFALGLCFAAACRPAPLAGSDAGIADATITDLAASDLARPAACSVSSPSPGALSALSGGNQSFAADIFRPLSAVAGNGDVLVSPYSVSQAFGMVWAGAAGDTAKQIASVFHFADSPEETALGFAALDCQIGLDANVFGNRLAVANSLFGQKNKTFQAPFLDLLAHDYGAPLQSVDFAANFEAARHSINTWVSQATELAIPELLKQGDLDGSTRLVLVNAVYFKGLWANAFNPLATSARPFAITKGAPPVSAPTMDTTGSFGFYQGPDFALLEMPYAGNKLAFDVLLPTATDGLTKLAAEFDPAHFATWTGQLATRTMEVIVPRFKVTSRFDLGKTLTGMGMPLVFADARADLSGMDGMHDLFVAKVIHVASLAVDEQGSVAAAGTGVVIEGDLAAVEYSRFTVDHPFLVVLRDLSTNTILFIGEVTNPLGG